MDEKKVREAIAKEKEAIKTLENIVAFAKIESFRRWAKDMIENSTIIIEALKKQLPKNDLISRRELLSRLDNSANRYHGGKCNGIEYKNVETFDVDEVYEIIDRVWAGVPEHNGEID